MTTTSTFAKLVAELDAAFEADKRNDGSAFVKFRDDAPDWCKEMSQPLHEALDDRFPDDWGYDIAAHIASNLTGYTLHDADDAREYMAEIADGLVDVYNADRSRWLASNLNNASLVDEACEEMGDGSADTFTRIGYGQYMAIERIGHALIQAVEAEADDRE